MAVTDFYSVVAPIEPYHNAIRFLEGDSDDYIQIDASGAAQAAGNATGALMCWVMIADDANSMTAIGYGDKTVVEFIELNVEAGLLTCRCTDNTTAQFVTQADGDALQKHKWYYIAAVQRGDGTGVHLFINGSEIDATHDTNTDLDAWFDQCAGIDSGRIGAANKVGNDSITQEFHGYIGAVRIYDDSKTDAEVKAIYEYELHENDSNLGRTNDTTDLLNHYNWDGDLLDAGSGADDGTQVGATCLTYGANEFISKLTFNPEFTSVTADNPRFAINGKLGVGLIVDAA